MVFGHGSFRQRSCSSNNNSRTSCYCLVFPDIVFLLLVVAAVSFIATMTTMMLKTTNSVTNTGKDVNSNNTGLAFIFSPHFFLSVANEAQKSSSSSSLTKLLLLISSYWPQHTIDERLHQGIQSQRISIDVEKKEREGLFNFSSAEEEKGRKGKNMRVLYIMTTMDEYNSGTRSTTRGSDRVQETLIPILSEGVQSLVNSSFDVDVFLISHYTLSPQRLKLIRNRLPKSVGLQIWDDATPLGYNTPTIYNEKKSNLFKKKSKVSNKMTALARQHRFVLKDKFSYYDFFICFEDDILIKSDHVQNFIQMTNRLHKLREMAPKELPNLSRQQKEKSYYGPMTKDQLIRTIPGFIRVEVLLDESRHGAQRNLAPVPMDHNFSIAAAENNTFTTTTRYVDPIPCCHLSEKRVMKNKKIPASPTHDKLIIWEVDISALGVRKMPPIIDSSLSSNNETNYDYEDNYTLDWVVLQRGPNPTKIPSNAIYGDYWSGTKGYYGKKGRNSDLYLNINNQAGWMATKRQIYEWHTTSYEDQNAFNENNSQLLCQGGFLPPYNNPHYSLDGLDLSVEWWSGGLQLVTARNGCNMQRVINIHPTFFSKHLLYHASNNKQTQLSAKRERFTKASNLFAQLNTVRKDAQHAMEQESLP